MRLSISWRRRLMSAAAVISASFGPTAYAQLTYVSQTRFVSSIVGAAGHDSPASIVSAPDLGSFDGTSSVVWTGPDYYYPGSAQAHQTSSLSATGIVDDTQFKSDRPFALGTGHTLDESMLDVVFNVTESTPFSLSGLMPARKYSNWPVEPRSVKLTGPGVAIDLTGPGAFNQTGSFSPGQYELIVHSLFADISASTTSLNSNSNVVLALPEPVTASAIALSGLLLRRRRR